MLSHLEVIAIAIMEMSFNLPRDLTKPMTQELCDFIDRSSSRLLTTLPRLMVIVTAAVEL